MKKYYVIQEMIGFGYFDEDQKAFKGWLYVTKYKSFPSHGLAIAGKISPCKVVEVYDHTFN